MSAVWLKIITAVCVCCTALADTEDRRVVWRDVGEAVTIQCRVAPGQESLYLKMGLSEDTDIFFTEGNSAKTIIADRYTNRLQSNGAFPNVDILIRNLTLNDTGPYWCVYRVFDMKTHKQESTKGDGSVLLVVKGDNCGAKDPVTHQDLSVVPVAISAIVLLCIIIAFSIMIILKLRCISGPIKASVVQLRPPEQEEDL